MEKSMGIPPYGTGAVIDNGWTKGIKPTPGDISGDAIGVTFGIKGG